jgi:hypothetical protein
MDDQGVVLGQLDPERLAGEPFPVLFLELVSDPLVGRPKPGEWKPGALSSPPPQTVLIVIAANGPAAKLAYHAQNTY